MKDKDSEENPILRKEYSLLLRVHEGKEIPGFLLPLFPSSLFFPLLPSSPSSPFSIH